jgi:hypothetical protein
VPPASRLPLSRFLSASAVLLLLLGACATAPIPPPGTKLLTAPAAPRIAAPDRPAGSDALPRWRQHFEAFSATISDIDLNFIAHESADSPLPDLTREQLAPAVALLDQLHLATGETLVLPTLHGPETPFPDHHSLRQIASVRTLRARLALAEDDLPTALSLVRANLAQARATLRSQAGIIPLIHAAGVWQAALDGVHAFARHPGLPAAEARELLSELQSDATLAQVALDRALRGEYAHVYRVIVERMPITDDPDLALSAVATLGMAEPDPLPPGEIGLGLTEHTLLDPAATLSAYEADLAPYLSALMHDARLPRGLFASHTANALGGYLSELGPFHEYASGEGETTLELIVRARAALESTTNPIGKLLAVYLTPPWEVILSNSLRREAQRSALCGLLAWRLHGRPASWEEIVAAGHLAAPPADPFSDGALRYDLGENARVWSVYLSGTDDGGEHVEGNMGQPADLVWIR